MSNPLSGDERKKKILDAGAALAAKYGAVNVTRRMVAKACKVSDPLIAHYMGSAKDAQTAYRRHMKKLGLVEPTKDKIEAAGIKLRAKSKGQPERKRTVKEVKAIKNKAAAKPVSAPKPKAKIKPKAKAKPVSAPKPKPKPTPAPENKDKGAAPENKGKAARKPKAPPVAPAAPPLPPPLPLV